MAKKKEYRCTVVYTEGWEKRVTEAFVDLYYKRIQIGAEEKDKKEETA